MMDENGVGEVGNPKCGDIMRMYIKVENGVIQDVSFMTFGCGAAIATSSMATELIKGKSVEDALKLTNKAVMEALDGLPPVKVHCSVLAEQAIKAAVADYYRRQGIDPTPYVAITYMLLFGIMFGDLGQGLVVALLGLIVQKKGIALGGVMSRIGLTSMVFGFLYGSVFGVETMLIPVHRALFGRDHLIEVMEPSATNFLLIAAIAIGAVIIILSISLNVMLGFREKNLERAVFSNNGLAGLVFYCAVIFAAVSTLMLGNNVLTPVYVVPLLVVPLLLMFFKEPLGRLLEKKEPFPDGFGGFFVESFFEMFEVLLSFITNTMSFIRVGSFVLVHAGMMIVVFTLSGMVGGVGSIIIAVVGNIFVMGIEGLIVGIQVLRLEFYEIFSRFFDSDGLPFQPVGVDNA